MASGGTVLVIVVALGSGIHCDESASARNEYPTILLEKIRRQLMKENYDYMSAETEEDLTKRGLSTRLPASQTLSTAPPATTASQTNSSEPGSDVNQNFISRTNYNKPKEREDDDQPVDKKDLLYYVDDDRLMHRSKAVEAIQDVMTNGGETLVETSVKPKYKVLKVRQPYANRRSGQAYRSFIQEETADGVAIINLNDEPFPEFRLPRGRRQYMNEDGLDSQLEIDSPSESDH